MRIYKEILFTIVLLCFIMSCQDISFFKKDDSDSGNSSTQTNLSTGDDTEVKDLVDNEGSTSCDDQGADLELARETLLSESEPECITNSEFDGIYEMMFYRNFEDEFGDEFTVIDLQFCLEIQAGKVFSVTEEDIFQLSGTIQPDAEMEAGGTIIVGEDDDPTELEVAIDFEFDTDGSVTGIFQIGDDGGGVVGQKNEECSFSTIIPDIEEDTSEELTVDSYVLCEGWLGDGIQGFVESVAEAVFGEPQWYCVQAETRCDLLGGKQETYNSQELCMDACDAMSDDSGECLSHRADGLYEVEFIQVKEEEEESSVLVGCLDIFHGSIEQVIEPEIFEVEGEMGDENQLYLAATEDSQVFLTAEGEIVDGVLQGSFEVDENFSGRLEGSKVTECPYTYITPPDIIEAAEAENALAEFGALPEALVPSKEELSPDYHVICMNDVSSSTGTGEGSLDDILSGLTPPEAIDAIINDSTEKSIYCRRSNRCQWLDEKVEGFSSEEECLTACEEMVIQDLRVTECQGLKE